jgi:ferredoxin--NADP+ reductase
VPGKPEGEWPWYYINPDDCIDCGACEEECPKDAIFEDAVILREHKEHTDAIAINRRFFEEGPGYKAKEM